MINIQVIPHKDQRYNTVGDWYYDASGLTIKVSDTGDLQMNCLLIVHELVESLMCMSHGVTSQLVDDFDLANIDHPEPGSIPGCPYYYEHMVATMIERMIAGLLDVDWDSYDMVVEELWKSYES